MRSLATARRHPIATRARHLRAHDAAWRPIAALAVALALVGCGRKAAADQSADTVVRQGSKIQVPATSPLRSALQVDSVALGDVQSEFSAAAAVEADPAHVARIVPPLAGRVVKLHVRFGDVVRPGQPLVTLDAPDFGAAVADYQRARSQFTQAQRTRDREADLRDKGVASVRDVEQAETDLAQAKSEVDRTTARLQALGIDPNEALAGRTLVVRAPMAGVVDDVTAAEGEYRNDASVPMMLIADLSTVWLTANVQEKDIHAVAKGQAVDAVFAAYPDQHIQGTVFSVGNLLDPDTRTVKVRVALPNPKLQFKPGMFATMRFHGRTAPAILVPTTAIVQLRDTTYVYAEVAPWTFEPRPVTLGLVKGDKTVIPSGLAPGDRVIVRGALLLQ